MVVTVVTKVLEVLVMVEKPEELVTDELVADDKYEELDEELDDELDGLDELEDVVLETVVSVGVEVRVLLVVLDELAELDV